MPEYHYLVGAEEASRAASRIESAVGELSRHASTIAESTQKLTTLVDAGYGAAIPKLIEFIEDGRFDRLLAALEKKDGAA